MPKRYNKVILEKKYAPGDIHGQFEHFILRVSNTWVYSYTNWLHNTVFYVNTMRAHPLNNLDAYLWRRFENHLYDWMNPNKYNNDLLDV